MAHLRVLTGPLQGKVFTLEHDVTIGRMPRHAIAMTDNNRCSRDHAKVRRSGPHRFEIVDLASTFGTFVNEERVARKILADGDVIQIGDATLKFESTEAR